MSNVDELLTSARAALEARDTLVARGYLRRAARMAPDRLDIWVDLCRVTERPEDRVKCLERIVELDPANAEARQELRRLQSGAQESGAQGTCMDDDSQVDILPDAPLRVDTQRTEQEPNRQRAPTAVAIFAGVLLLVALRLLPLLL